MAKPTYLEIVTGIVHDLNGLNNQETIFTLHQTLESTEVTRIVKESYFTIIDGKDWPHLYQPFQLTATSGTTPTHMTIPTDVMDFEYIKYNVRDTTDTKDKFVDIPYLTPKAFMDMVDARDSSATEITQVTDTSGIYINVFNERKPSYWTSFDDSVVVFDSYDSVVDTTNMVAIKTQCRGKIYPVVTESDTFVFDLPTDAFSYLIAESKSIAFVLLRQASNAKAEQQSNTHRRRMSSEAHVIDNSIKYPNYGRKGKK